MHYSDLCRDLGILDGNELSRLETLEEEVVQFIDNRKMVDAANVSLILLLPYLKVVTYFVC